MNQLDNLLYAKICDYFPLVNCNSSDITNLMTTNSTVREMVKDNAKIEQHRVVTFTRRYSKIKWISDRICLTCHRIKEDDFNELVHIRNAFSNIHDDFNQLVHMRNAFSNVHAKRDRKKCYSPIFIHRNTQQELETFLVKLAKVTNNVIISRNYCCGGKGVEIDLSY